MRRHFFISDTHFGHANILKYSRRLPFMTNEEAARVQNGEDVRISIDSVRRMNGAFVDNINRVVQAEDVLWFLGDWVWSPREIAYEEALRWREQLQCNTIHFVWGNHDVRSIGPVFSSDHDLTMIAIDRNTGDYVIGEAKIFGADVDRYRGWQRIVLCHYQMLTWHGANKGVWHLYGHSHGSAEAWSEKHLPGRRSLDAGIDNAATVLGDYRPWSFEEIAQIMEARSGIVSHRAD